MTINWVISEMLAVMWVMNYCKKKKNDIISLSISLKSQYYNICWCSSILYMLWITIIMESEILNEMSFEMAKLCVVKPSGPSK